MAQWARRYVASSLALAGVAAPAIKGSPSGDAVPEMGKLKLRHVQIVFRHGARTPITPLPGYGFPAVPGSEFQCGGQQYPVNAPGVAVGRFVKRFQQGQGELRLAGWCRKGQLTEQGRADLREVGQWIRQRYILDLGFLSPQFDSRQCLIRSTDVERTIESAVALLEELYQADQVSAQIAINCFREDDENMYPRSSCKSLKTLKMASLRESTAQREALRQQLNDDFFAAIQISGQMEGRRDCKEKISRFEGLHNTTSCYIHNKVALPMNISPDLLSRIQDEAVKEMNAKYNSIATVRLAIGLFLGDIFADLRSVIQSPSAMTPDGRTVSGAGNEGVPQLRLYSGHDNTLGPLFIALTSDPSAGKIGAVQQWPEFAANITIELYEETAPTVEEGVSQKRSRFWVRALYNKGRQTIELPGSSVDHNGLVEVDVLMKRLAELVPERSIYHRECQL